MKRGGSLLREHDLEVLVRGAAHPEVHDDAAPVDRKPDVPAGLAALGDAGLEPPPLFVLAAEVARRTGRQPPSARTPDLLEFCRGR